MGRDSKISETYLQREDEDILKWANQQPEQKAAEAKPAKAEPKKAEGGGLVDAVRQFGLGIADLPNKAADLLYPKEARPKEEIAPGATDLTPGQTIRQGLSEAGEVLGNRMAQGVEQVKTAMAGKSKPVTFGGKTDVMGQEPETPEQKAAAQPSFSSDKLGFFRDLLSGSFGVAMPFGALAGHALGEAYDYNNLYSGAMTDEVLRARLQYNKEKYGNDAFETQLVQDLLNKPYEQRLADGRAMAEMVGEAISGFIPGYTGLASVAKGLTSTGKAAAKGAVQTAEQAGRAAVGASAEEGARVAAGQAEWAKRMKPEQKALPPGAYEMPPSSLPGEQGAKAAEAAPAPAVAAEAAPGTAKPAGEAKTTPPDIQDWADGVVAGIKGPGDLEGQLRASVEATKKAKGETPMPGPGAARRRAMGNEVGAVRPDVALALSRAALGAVLGGMVGEDPESAAIGAAAGLLAPRGVKALRTAFREGRTSFVAGREAESAAKGALSDAEAADLVAKAQAGGFSYQVGKKAHMAEPEGYMVSIAPERGVHVSGEITPQDIKKFAADNADVLRDPRAHMGAEKVDGGYNLDISVHTKSQREAHGLGAANAQERIWDIKGNAPINVQHGVHRGMAAKQTGELTPEELRVADEYDKAVTDPSQKPAWDKLIAETEAEYERLSKKLNIEFVDGQPYSKIEDMVADMKAGNLKVSKVAADQHPYWSAEQNMKFRAVHDFYGHSKGADFSLKGEHKAFLAQAETLTSPEARHALQTEVYGQAASFYKNQAFGEQKAFLSKQNMNLPPIEKRLGGDISGGAPVAQVKLKGYQSGYQDIPGFELFNLEHDIPGHPKGSTVTADTIAEAGYRMPPEIENALAPRAGESAYDAMGGTKAMSEAEGKAALEQVRANEKILSELRQMREAGRYEPNWIDTLWSIFKNEEGRIGAKLPQTKEALALMKKELPGTDWYKGIREELQTHFGDDWQLVADLIAATSPNTRVAENVDMALTAYAAFKRGETAKAVGANVGSYGDVKLKVQGLLEGKSLEEVLKSREKVWNFAAALKGDLNAVVIDRWMWRIFYPDEVAKAEAKGATYTGTGARYKLISDWITGEAAKIGLQPAELQAGLWCAKKIADGDPAGIKPLREFIGAWMAENKGLNEGLDFFQNVGKLPGMNEAGKIELGTAMLLARAAIGGAVGASLGEDPTTMATYALMGSGLGSVASVKVMKRLASNLKPEARASLDDLTTMLKQRGEQGLPPISGGSDAFIPKEIFKEFAAKTVPPKDLRAAHMDLNQKLDYARRLGEGVLAGDDLLVDAVKQSRFKSVEDVFKLDPASVSAIDAPGVVKDMKAMNAFVLEDLMQSTARAKLLGTPEAADAVAKRYAYAGRYSQRVSDMEKAIGRQAMHPERMQAVVDFDTLTKEVAEYEAAIGGQIKSNSTLVEMISRTADRAAVTQLAEQGSRWPQALWNIYYGLNLLSSPLTHVKNIVGNIGGLGMYVADRAGGEFLVHPIFKLLGKGEEGVQFGETAQIVRGIWEMVGDSFRAQKKGAFQYGAEAFWSGESRFGKDTKASERIRMMAAKDTQGFEGPQWLAKTIDTMSTLAQYNMRFMDGTDEFFKMLSFNGELRALAKREAKLQSGKAGAKSMEELLQSPTTGMLQGAQEFAHENTFTKAFSANARDWQHLNGLGYQMQQVAGNPYARVLATPFFRTPTRVGEFSTVHTPGLNLLAAQFYSDLAAGGAKAELAFSKLATGMAIAGFTFYLAGQGVITGDWPKDPSLAQQYRANGWQPRSIYNPVLNKYHSYAGMAPLEHMLAGAANFAVAWPHLKDHELETMFWATTLTYGNSLTDNPFLQGASDIGDIVTAVHRGESVDGMLAYAQQRMLSLMPGAALGRQIQKAAGQGSDATEYRVVKEGPKDAQGHEDIGQRELTTLWGRTMQQVPGYGSLYGEGLPAKINYVDGKAIPSESGFLGMVFPWQVTTNRNDKVLNELQRLNGARFPKEMPYTLGGPMKNDSVIQKDAPGAEGVKLLTRERSEFAKLLATQEDENGDTFYQALEREIASDEYQDASDTNGKYSAQAARLHTIYDKFFDMARETFLTEHPEIKNLLEQRGLERDLDKLPKSRSDERAQRIQDLQDQQEAR